MTRTLKSLLVVATLATAGCAYQQPYYEVPGRHSSYGGSSYGWGSSRDPFSYYDSPYYFNYGYGVMNPYYWYRPGYPLYGYYRYPRYPGAYCLDANRDGRCDSKSNDRDDDRPGSGQGPGVNEPGRDRQPDDKYMPRDRVREPARVVPDSRGKKPPVARPSASPTVDATGAAPRAEPAPKRPPVAIPSRPAPVQARPSAASSKPVVVPDKPRVKEPPSQSPKLRQSDR
jgi:hypothetical protein